jgi:hypothetical protein
VFPDSTISWRPYPSIIDGIERPPFVVDQGLWRGTLHLIVVAPNPSSRAYGIEIACQVYAGVEEMAYSISDHSSEGLAYDGSVYIKEAESSALLRAFQTHVLPSYPSHKPRQFAFVGGDYCYEVLSFSEPVIRTFIDPEEAYAWGPLRSI